MTQSSPAGIDQSDVPRFSCLGIAGHIATNCASGFRAFDDIAFPQAPGHNGAAVTFAPPAGQRILIMQGPAEQLRPLNDGERRGRDVAGAFPEAPMISVFLREGDVVQEMAGRQCHAIDRVAGGLAFMGVL